MPEQTLEQKVDDLLQHYFTPVVVYVVMYKAFKSFEVKNLYFLLHQVSLALERVQKGLPLEG